MMEKYKRPIRIGFFWKVFAAAAVFMTILIFAAYVMLYFLLPHFYESYKENQYQDRITSLLSELDTASSLSDETAFYLKFAQKYGVDLIVLDADGSTLYDYYQSNHIVTNIADSGEAVPDITVELNGDNNDAFITERSYEVHGETRELILYIPLQPLNEARAVMISIYPFACLICILFALFFSLLLSGIYVRPIRQIGEMTKRMAALEDHVAIPCTSHDEIGDLSRDVNHLYSELKGTIDALQAEIMKYSDAENRKLDFLRTVSHELKNPLAAANALLQGMIYDVPPYDHDQKKYLTECSEMLEKAIELVREALTLSREEYREPVAEIELKPLIEEIVSDYRVILRSKHISYQENMEESPTITSQKNLLSKALSNIISNAVSYTESGGEIRIYTRRKEEGQDKKAPSGIDLVIENTCTPLSNEDLKGIFTPFHSTANQGKLSNGLGLYIVNQLFAILHIRYDFVPIEDGMRFEIYL